MHEHSFIEAILKNIENIENVELVKLEVGELAGIEACHLKEHILERVNFDVEVIEKSSKVKCDCGYEGKANVRERLHDLVIYDCPKCGSVPEVIEGKDIKILKIFYK